MSNLKTKRMVLISLFIAMILMLAVTPLGYIPVGVVRATTIHIPVIIGGILLGPKVGALLGFTFGMTSLVNNTINPTITSFVFTPFFSLGDMEGSYLSLIICFLPRILIGVVAYYVYSYLKKYSNKVAILTSGIVASMTNTVLVMGGIYVLFGQAYADAKGIPYGGLLAVIGSVISVNGVVEAILAGVVTVAVTLALQKVVSDK